MWDTFNPNLQFLEKFSSQYTFGWVGELLLNLEEKFFDSSIIWNELELITKSWRKNVRILLFEKMMCGII